MQTGLFATTVGSFIIATYPNLQPSSSDQSAATLLVISQQLSQITQLLSSPGTAPSQPLNITSPEAFVVTNNSIQVNVLWILSFFLSLFCALLTTLVQQWTRTYLADAQRRGSPCIRGPVHSYLRAGIERFGFNHAVDAIIALLHASVCLFAAGFLVFLLDLNDLVARTLFATVIVFGMVYMVMTMLPVFFPDCPFSTPLTLLFRILLRYPAIAGIRIMRSLVPINVYEDAIVDIWDCTPFRSATRMDHINDRIT
ncbi:hypothetical protein K488DRAFT_92827 [Vararia minispora EC-137]|uniref:Uncharacterized protein n=1 Tax=Vararia minispora EC-137 TaxID=1314806 RepID=A0ACB8Q3V2_9AGAM|nr:hypothetical protein K488DRAFT_92827 [Vararia minispora EC-137]